MFTRIHRRIAAGYVVLTAFIMLSLGFYLVSVLRTEGLRGLESHLSSQAAQIAAEAAYLSGTQGPASWADLAHRSSTKDSSANDALRVTLIARDGTVLGDSDRDPATMENHATRPEVQEALASGFGESQRHSTSVDRDLLYVAVPVQQGQDVIGVARLALSVNEVLAASNRAVAAVGVAFLFATMVALPLALLIARATTRPLQRLTEMAHRLEAGDLDQEIVVPGRDEVGELAHALNGMAREVRTHIRALDQERAQLAAVLAHMADGVVITDAEGRILLLNHAAETMLRMSGAHAEGRPIIEVLRDHELAALVRACLAGGVEQTDPRVVELSVPRRSLQVVASRIPDDPKARALMVFQDVTLLRQAETVRREFVANVSHELRTPVASIKALVETLEDGALEDPPAAREFVGRMHVEADRLAQLIEELLELARLESGRVQFHRRQIGLEAVVRSATERLRPQAERAGLKLSLDPGVELPEIAADPDRIERVVINLVHNAIKFTPVGGEVRVHIRRQGNEVVVAVADTGVGIASEDLLRLFERFYKVDRSRAGGGTGLGLAIAKHTVQAHGGRIWAESPGPGRGSTVSFTLPIGAGVRAAAANV